MSVLASAIASSRGICLLAKRVREMALPEWVSQLTDHVSQLTEHVSQLTEHMSQLTEHFPGNPWPCLLSTSVPGGGLVGEDDSSHFEEHWTWSFLPIFMALAKSRHLLCLAGNTEREWRDVGSPPASASSSWIVPGKPLGS